MIQSSFEFDLKFEFLKVVLFVFSVLLAITAHANLPVLPLITPNKPILLLFKAAK